MNDLGRVAQNAGWIVGCRLVQAVLALIINILTARYLGPSDFGVISYAASVVAFVTPLMKLGIPSIIVHELIKSPENEGELLGTAMVLNLMSSAACIVGIACFSCIANRNEPETIIVCVLYSIMLIFQSTEIVQYRFQAKLQSKYVSLAVLAAYVVVSIYKIYLLVTGKSVRWFAVSNALDYMLISVILFYLYRKQGGKPLRVSSASAGLLLRNGSYYILSDMMVVIFAQTDRVMLEFMRGSEAVGLYSAAAAIAGLTSFVFVAIVHSFQPAILAAHAEDKHSFEKNMSLLYCVVFYLSVSQSVVLTLFAKIAVHLLYGSAYAGAVRALQIIVWYTTFSYFGAVRNIWILAEGKQYLLWIINLLGAIGNVLLNVWLIPSWGINGAAFATLVTQLFTNVILGFIIKPIFRNNVLMLRGIQPKLLTELIGLVMKRTVKE